MFVEFGKNILGSVAQASAMVAGIKKLGETSEGVEKIKQGQSTQIETARKSYDTARKSYDTAQETLNETRNMYKLTQEDIERKRQQLLEAVHKTSDQKLTLSDIIAVDKQAREDYLKTKKMKEGGK